MEDAQSETGNPKVNPPGPILYKATRLKKIKEKQGREYSGTLYRLTFRTDREVKLEGLGFFGPWEAAFSDYTVKVEVRVTVKDYSGKMNCFNICGPQVHEYKLAEFAVRILQVPKGKIFTVKFPEPVRIMPDHWVDVKFELVGQKTCFMENMWDWDKIQLMDGTWITFEFLRGSYQLPEILFSV